MVEKNIKKSKKVVKGSAKKAGADEDLKKRYVSLFKSIAEIIQKENNISLVYQVLIDIVSQIEHQVSKKNGCSGCGHDCSGCSDE